MSNQTQICPALSEIEARVATFPAMPALCRKMIGRMNDPNMDFEVLSDEMRYDPGLTANVLKLANSAYFGTSTKVDSLQSAFVRLGVKQVFQIVMANGVANTLSATLPGYDLRPEELLAHSVWTAVAAEELTKELGIDTPDLMFTAGLLHDLGKIIMDEFVQANLPDIQDSLDAGHPSFDEAEEHALGISHAEVGARLLESWHFPTELVSAVRWHHCPESAESHKILVSMVHLADMLAYAEGIGTGVDGLRYEISCEAALQLGLRTRSLEAVASRTLEKMRELESMLT